MSEKSIEIIASYTFCAILCIGVMLLIIILEKLSNEHELKKLGIATKSNKIIDVTTDYKEKLKFQIKSCIVFVITIFAICLLGKLFGFGIKDIANIFK